MGESSVEGAGCARADSSPRRVLALSSSPRRKGNSRLLAEAILEGAAAAGHSCELVHLPDHVREFLRNCRECRQTDGSCSIPDGYREVFLDKMLPADALVLATPVWWYGMSAQLKNVFDRMFCYYANSYPGHDEVREKLVGKRVALALSAEENNISARLAILHQMQELCRYLHYSLVGAVTGIGNSTGEVVDDPSRPLAAARELGQRLFQIRETDYKMDSERPARVWSEPGFFPTYWR